MASFQSKIVQIAQTLAVSDGGPARNSFELNLALNRKEDVTAHLLWVNGRPEESILAAHDTSRCPLPVPGPRKIGRPRNSTSSRYLSFLDFLSTLRSADIVVIHGYYLWWIPLVAAFLTLCKVPYVITPHGSLTKRQMTVATQKKRIYELTVGWFVRRQLATFITGSPVEASEIGEQFPNCSVKVGGVGTSLPEAYKAGASVCDPVRLLCLSRIAPKKRLDLCIEAVGALSAAGTKAKLTIAGHGDAKLLGELQELVTTLGLKDSVEFIGQVEGEAKSQAFLEADVFLLPSDDENFGIGLAEALAHGLPCVASENVASAAAIQGRGGIVLPSPNGATIAEAILNLVNGQVGQSRADARITAEQSFSWDAVSDQWMCNLIEAYEKRQTHFGLKMRLNFIRVSNVLRVLHKKE